MGDADEVAQEQVGMEGRFLVERAAHGVATKELPRLEGLEQAVIRSFRFLPRARAASYSASPSP